MRAAVHPTAQSATLYRADPNKLTAGWQHGLGSFSRDHLLKYGVSEEAIVSEEVACLSLVALIDRHLPGGRKVDIMVTDTEGFDDQIMAMVDLQRIKPGVIRYESKHLSDEVASRIASRLRVAGYNVAQCGDDAVAVERALSGRSAYLRAALR